MMFDIYEALNHMIHTHSEVSTVASFKVSTNPPKPCLTTTLFDRNNYTIHKGHLPLAKGSFNGTAIKLAPTEVGVL